jgi:hypothetical protein
MGAGGAARVLNGQGEACLYAKTAPLPAIKTEAKLTTNPATIIGQA